MLATQVQYWSYKENQRHNLVFERQNQQSINENIRHNKVTEDLGYRNLAETARHNKASEAIGWGNIRLGYANLSEQRRHNVATESIGRQQASASLFSSYAALNSSRAAQAQARASNVTARSNWMNSVTKRYEANTGRMTALSTISKNKANIQQGWVNTLINAGNASANMISSVGRFLDAVNPY